MRNVFDRVTQLSIRFRGLTIALSLLLVALGVYAALDLSVELLPSIEFPSVFVLARTGGPTSGDIMLQAYTIPIEEGAQAIDGVVNLESSTTAGVAFLQIRSEFGLDQTRIRGEIERVLEALPVPTRTIRPAAGTTAQDMIGELSPEVVLYLYALSLQENVRFLSALSQSVWESFSPEVLASLPEPVFEELDPNLARSLLARRVPNPLPLPEPGDPAPALPPSWQMDRFSTADDLFEIAGVRSLADIFNDFVQTGTITGPLAYVSDLNETDLRMLLDLERRCRQAQTEAVSASAGDEAPVCRVFAYLDGASTAALIAHFGADVQGADARLKVLPEGFFEALSTEDQVVVSAALVAQQLTGEVQPRDALLPQEWLFERPQLITFTLDDVPLGVVSVSGEMSGAELRHLVENELVPRLEALDSVADVTVEGGERIRPDLLASALEAEGLPPEEEQQSVTVESGNPDASPASATAGDNPSDANQASVQATASLPEGPALPVTWSLFATQLPGVEELNTADDLFAVPGIMPSTLFNQAAAMAVENPAVAAIVNRAIADLSVEVWQYLAEHEQDFYAALSNHVLQLLSDDVLAGLPSEVQARAAAARTPPLGEFWVRLSAEPELAGLPLTTAADLANYGEGAAATLNKIRLETPAELGGFTTLLLSDISPEVVSHLIDVQPGFVEAIAPETLCAMSPATLSLPALAERWSTVPWSCSLPDGTTASIADIASGAVPSAAQRVIGTQAASRIHDPEAPLLPSTWPAIASFVGAQELDTADDLFFTVRNGDVVSPSQRLNDFASPDGAAYLQVLQADVLLYIADCSWGQLCEEGFFEHLSDRFLSYLPDETASALPQDIQERRQNALLGIYVPQQAVTRTNGSHSLILNIRKSSGANTVEAWSNVERVLEQFRHENEGIDVAVAFEQASYIEESISGVAREGGLGAVMAVVVILIFLNFSVRSTLVTAVSIPTSVGLALVTMRWLPPNAHALLLPMSESAGGLLKDTLTFVLRLFPSDVSLNIMTLSGLTVAIGRVVDDSIVVLENIYRHIQTGEDRLRAVLHGTRDVSLAIFAATVTTVVVFLPIGLFGGIIGAFFLPFGLAVTYALMASFVVAITVVPLLAYLFIGRKPEVPHESWMERAYRRIITQALKHRWTVMAIATSAFVVGAVLLTQLPTAFLPAIGEPTITVSVDLPPQIDGRLTTIADTDAKVRRLERFLETLEGIKTYQTSVGAGSEAVFVASSAIDENVATITISVSTQERLDALTPIVRAEAERIFNDLDRDGQADPGVNAVKVSGASLSEQGFGGFALVVSGDAENPPTLAELTEYDALIIQTLEHIEGVTNVESSLSQLSAAGGDLSHTYIRVDGVPAARYTAELETDDTLGLTRKAIEAVRQLDLPDNLTVDQGYESQQQTEGFSQTFVSMALAVVIVYMVMVLTFGSAIHPITILFSLPLATVGAAVGLAVTGRVLGLSAVVGLLMLVGIVVTNAIVLIDRVQTNRRVHNLPTRQALIEGGTVRLRPILMTAVATMVALLPLAIGLSQGAIIAAELGTVVIGGLFSSTLLTLIVVPVVYSLIDGLRARIAGIASTKPRARQIR